MMPDTDTQSDDVDTYAIFEEAHNLILKPGSTDDDRKLAYALVDALGDEQLSALLRRTVSDWSSNNPLPEASVPNDAADSVAYDYDDEDGEDGYEELGEEAADGDES